MTKEESAGTVGTATAMFIAVANMVGTGVFTSLGYQIIGIQSPFALLMLWIIGGLLALAGASCYAELGAALPRSGGEYHFLSVIYHPAVGFVAGWVSLIAGFAAPTALAAIAFAKYAGVVFDSVSANHLAACSVIVLSAIHGLHAALGRYFQDVFTILKIILILFFIVAGLSASEHQSLNLIPDVRALSEMASPFYFISLVYVSFAYTGWNAAAYFVREIRNPERNLKKALFYATFLVMILYVFLNYVFLYVVPAGELSGRIEIGFIAGSRLLGEDGGAVISLIISVLMLSTIGAMVFIGARINQVIGRDYRLFSPLARVSKLGTPLNAIFFQGLVTLFFIYSSTFEQVIVYATFTLMLMNSLTVGGVFILRFRAPRLRRPYRTWGYPFTPVFFLIANMAIIWYVCAERPVESLAGAGVVSLGFVLYYFNSRTDAG